jgi:MFS family permease
MAIQLPASGISSGRLIEIHMRNDTSNPHASGRIVLAATILGSSMAFIDGTVVNVALPALQNAMHASIADVQWVVESYALLLAALLLVGGSLGEGVVLNADINIVPATVWSALPEVQAIAGVLVIGSYFVARR